MSTSDDPRRHTHAAPALGPAIDRRTALRGGLRAVAGLTLAAGLPGALAACGTRTVVERTTTYQLVIGRGGTPPIGDLVRLTAARARSRGVSPVLTDPDTDLLGFLHQVTTTYGPVDPVTAKRSLTVGALVVIGLPDPAELDPIVAATTKGGTKVVSFLVPLTHPTAAISADPARSATLLATHAAGWARERLAGRGSALLVLPGDSAAGSNSFASLAPAGERALRKTLARLAPDIDILALRQPATVRAFQRDLRRTLERHPGIGMVLCWDDVSAVIVAQLLRAGHASRPGDKLYVGGQGVPALTSRETVAELRHGDVLRAVVAVRAGDLADALVDLPRLILRGEQPHDVEVAPQTLTPGSPALAAFARDYDDDPDRVLAKVRDDARGGVLNLNPLDSR